MNDRDQFAAAALTGLIADDSRDSIATDAMLAYEYADAMLKARGAEQPELEDGNICELQRIKHILRAHGDESALAAVERLKTAHELDAAIARDVRAVLGADEEETTIEAARYVIDERDALRAELARLKEQPR